MDVMGRLIVGIALTCIPLGITIGFLTDDKYKNPFVFVTILFFVYVGATIWVKSKKKK